VSEAAAGKAAQAVPFRDWVAVYGAILGAFMAVLDIQITNASLEYIQGGLAASLDEGTWISTAYYCCVTRYAKSLILLPFLARALGQDCRAKSIS